MPLIKFPNVNAAAVCDCGHQTFKVGVEVMTGGENHVRVFECCNCGKQMPFPFQSQPRPPLNPTAYLGDTEGYLDAEDARIKDGELWD